MPGIDAYSMCQDPCDLVLRQRRINNTIFRTLDSSPHLACNGRKMAADMLTSGRRRCRAEVCRVAVGVDAAGGAD